MSYARRLNTAETMQTVFVTAFSLLLIALNIVRIVNIPMTFDECGNYPLRSEHYLDMILHFQGAANNHPLNSLMRKFFIETFGNTPFFARLDNLIAQVLYLICSYLLCRKLFSNRLWQLSVFVLLNLQPFMFEFWGLSRGYGLAIGFMAAAAYYIVLYVQHWKVKHLYYSLLAAVLAVYSNFALLNFYCALIGVIIIIPLLSANRPNLISLAKGALPAVIICTGVLYFLTGEAIKILQQTNQLYYGGDRDLIHDTTMSLVSKNFYTSNAHIISIMAYGVALLTLVIAIYWVVRILRGKIKAEHINGLVLWLLFIIPLASTLFQHMLLHVKYLIDRTALFFIPLWLLQVAGWLYVLKAKKTALSILTLLTGVTIFNFCKNFNISRTYMWWFDAYNVQVLRHITSETKNQPTKVKLAVSWMFYPSMWYYTYSQNNTHFADVASASEAPKQNDTMYDYYYLPEDQSHNLLNSGKYKIDTSYNWGVFLLLKKQ